MTTPRQIESSVSNHPSRGPKGPAANPAPDEIRAARTAAKLTQIEAAALVYRSERNWQQWEGKERRMDPALWELFTRKLAEL